MGVVPNSPKQIDILFAIEKNQIWRDLGRLDDRNDTRLPVGEIGSLFEKGNLAQMAGHHDIGPSARPPYTFAQVVADEPAIRMIPAADCGIEALFARATKNVWL